MELYILNTSLEKIGVIDSASSVIWTERYYEAGDFEIYIKASDTILNMLQVDNYVMRYESQMVGIIEKISINTDAENGDYITATGRDLKSIFDRRIIWNQSNIYGNFEDAIRKIITDNVINPTISARKISNIKLGSKFGITTKIDTQSTGDNLYEKIIELSQNVEAGWRVTLNGSNFIVSFYKGVDRSYNQSANNYVVFSPKFDNLISTDYQDDKTTLKNVALVAGEGEGTARKRRSIGTVSGLARRELYVDANDISTNNGEISATKYNNLLDTRGYEKLAEVVEVVAFSGEIDTTRTYILNEDYYLGDIVQAENEYGITGTTRIIEIIEAEDDNGISIIPTFEEWR